MIPSYSRRSLLFSVICCCVCLTERAPQSALHHIDLDDQRGHISRVSSWTGHFIAPASAEERPVLARRHLAIRNGSPTSTLLNISPQQERAIGWLSTSDEVDPKCTGTVISWSAVITARHCFESEEELTRYFVPSDSVSDGVLGYEASFTFRARDIHLNTAYDVAIIRFQGEPFRDLDLEPLPVNTYPLERSLLVNLLQSQVELAGYGTTHHLDLGVRHYAALNLELVTPEFLMVNGDNEQGICPGDSGGPLLAAGADGRATIFGVESQGDPCCVGYDQIVRTDLRQVQEALRRSGVDVDVSSGALRSSRCWGISEARRCLRDVLQYCDGDRVIEEDCAERGLECVYLADDDRFGCGSTECEYAQGYCGARRNAAVYCERGVERVLPCGEGFTCGFLEGSDRPICLNDDESDKPELCDDRYADRVREASQARFLTESGCQSSPSQDHSALWAALFMMALISKARLLSHRR